MKPFTYAGLPSRVVFGAGSIAQLPAEPDRAARLATEAPYPNPAPVKYEAVLALLRDAFEGRRPAP